MTAKIIKYQPKQQTQGQKQTKRQYTKSISGGGGYVQLRRELIKRLGDAETIYLMELVGWLDHYTDNSPNRIKDGYFPVTVETMLKAVGYNYDKQHRIKKKLKKFGLIKFKRGDWNGQLLFSVDIDNIKALIEDEKQSAGNVLTDPRFKRALRKTDTHVLPKRERRSCGKSKDGLSENPKTHIYETHNDSPFSKKDQKGGRTLAGARSGPLSSDPDAGDHHPSEPVEGIEAETPPQQGEAAIAAEGGREYDLMAEIEKLLPECVTPAAGAAD